MCYIGVSIMHRGRLIMKSWFWFAVLALIWSLYYLAMHITGGILTLADIVICGCVIAACIALITVHIIRSRKQR